MSDQQDTATVTPYVVRVESDNRHVYQLATDSGPFAHWPAASMSVRHGNVHVALSRSLNGGDVLVVALVSEDDARELCEAHAVLMAKLAEVSA